MRYLSWSESWCILDISQPNNRILPKSIGKLYHLQTLNLNAWSSIEFTQEISNLISLLHLSCDHSRIQAHEDVGLLTSLRTFPFFQVCQQKGRRAEELDPLKHLGGTLEIRNLEEIGSKKEAVKADLHGKQNLHETEFTWSNWHNHSDKYVLDSLQPPANVKMLIINSFSGDSFPEWAMSMEIITERNWIPLANIMRITLSGCCNCVNISILEDLQLLQHLVLMSMHNVTCLSSSSDQMKPLSSSLRSLELRGMKNLEKWSHTGKKTMLSPVLEKLTIYQCRKIIKLDESLQHPLVNSAIAYCENLKFVQSIQGLTALQSLSITDYPSLSEIPDLHNQGCSLKNLAVKDCDQLTCLPEGLDCLSLLKHLELGPFSEKLNSFPSLSGIIEKLGNHWESIPEDIQHLKALNFLSIDGFGVRELLMYVVNQYVIYSRNRILRLQRVK